VPPSGEPLRILLADDDPEDRCLVEKALKRTGLATSMDTVEDGADLLDYLNRRGEFAHLAGSPLPGLVLVDLNMPRVNGNTALQEIRATETLNHLPVVMLTTSRDEEDVYRSYQMGANAYVSKPASFAALIEVMRGLVTWWSQNALP